MARWIPILLEGLRRAVPWVLERMKMNGADTLPAVRDLQERAQRIEQRVDRLHDRLDVIVRDQGLIVNDTAGVGDKLDAIEAELKQVHNKLAM